MSQRIVLFLIDKFIDALKEEDESKFPCKNMLSKIKDDLENAGRWISHDPSTLSAEKTDVLRESVYSLDEIMRECLALSKKRKESGKIFMKYYTPSDLLLLHRFKERLQNIKQELQGILTQMPTDLIRIRPPQRKDPAGSTDAKEKTLQWTSSTINPTKIYGWDKEVAEINKELVKETNGLNTVGIVGMFGAGKSTLAQKIFVSKEVLDRFLLRLWVWVSPDCEKEELVRRMLDNLRVEEEEIEWKLKKNPNKDKLGVLLFILYLQLINKRYLIVFDDVRNLDGWYTNLQAQPPKDREWDCLAYGLPKGNGSAIIITSRKEDDAWKMVGNGNIYTPKPLIGDEAWALFLSSFQEGGKTLRDATLEELKQEITIKCGGLPISLITAGKEMACLKEKNEEEYVLQEMSSDDPRPKDKNHVGDGTQAEDTVAEEGLNHTVSDGAQAGK